MLHVNKYSFKIFIVLDEVCTTRHLKIQHGHLNCSDSQTNKYCYIQCDSGYDLALLQYVFICDYETGLWNQSIEWVVSQKLEVPTCSGRIAGDIQ